LTLVHHFKLAPDGGSIRLEVMDASQLKVREQKAAIRAALLSVGETRGMLQ
jgi:hypothetical protein